MSVRENEQSICSCTVLPLPFDCVDPIFVIFHKLCDDHHLHISISTPVRA